MCPTKIGYPNALSLGKNSFRKKRNATTLNSTHQAKNQCNFDSGRLERQQCDLHKLLLNIVNLEYLFGVGTKLKKIYSKKRTKQVPLFQPEHGFCQQNEPERGQVLVSE